MNLYTKSIMLINRNNKLLMDSGELDLIRTYLLKHRDWCHSNQLDLFQTEKLWLMYCSRYGFGGLSRRNYKEIAPENLEGLIEYINEEFEWL